MLKHIEVQGRTEEEAIENALVQLGLSRDDVSVEVLETAKTGLFGLKNTPALVKVEYEADEKEEPIPAEIDISSAKTPAKDSGRKSRAYTKADKPSVPLDDELGQRIDNYLKGLFERMDLDVGIDISDGNGSVKVALTAADPGVLIGRRGETLDAMQHLANYSINRSASNRVRIHLDVENYRQRRSQALEELALRTAGKVVKYRRNLTLDPMNAYERHIIHAALQDHANISTFSVGDDANRRVVVAYGQNAESTESTEIPKYKEWH